MKTYILGDVHGMYDKLMACLQAVNFDYENDRLISLGDLVDRGPDSFLVVEELLKIRNLVAIRGNHDATWRDALLKEDPLANTLYKQGGRETYQSYLKHCHETSDGRLVVPLSHFNFFVNTQINYWVDENNNCYVHGGFNRHEPIEGQLEGVLNWDRDLFMSALSYKAMKDNTHPFRIKDNFNHIFVGHTPTLYWGVPVPITAANITNLDTGAGKSNEALLTIMNLETREYEQR